VATLIVRVALRPCSQLKAPHREDCYQAVAPITAHRPRARKPAGQSLGDDLRGLRFQSEVETSACVHPLPLRPTVHLAGVVRCVPIKWNLFWFCAGC